MPLPESEVGKDRDLMEKTLASSPSISHASRVLGLSRASVRKWADFHRLELPEYWNALASAMAARVEKRCSDCKAVKLLSEFAKNSSKSDGLNSICRQCMSTTKAPYNAAYSRKWRKNNPDKHRETQQKRRAQKVTARVDVVINLTVFERDEWVCQLCRGKVDPESRWPEPLSPSLDHVIPLSRGGDHSYSNTQLAHLVCNMSKGNKLNVS